MTSDIDWWRDRDLAAEQLASIVLDVISTSSVRHVTTTTLAQRVQCSRSGLHKRHGNLASIFASTSLQVLAYLDQACRVPWLDGSRRLQFETLWTRVHGFLSSSRGQAFRKLRAHLASPPGLASGAREELSRLPSLTRWIADAHETAEARALAIWAICLAAAESRPDEALHAHLRELGWTLVAGPDALEIADDLEVEPLVPSCLGPLLPVAPIRTPAAPPSP